MHLPSWPFAQLLLFWGGWQFDFDPWKHNPTEYAKHVECPVLLMHGALDPRVKTVDAKALFDQLPKQKTFVLFSKTGHESYLESDPVAWERAVASFMLSTR
jgi:uncharacterized protein